MRAEVSLVYKNEKKRKEVFSMPVGAIIGIIAGAVSFDHSGKSQNRSAGGGICY